MGRLGRVLGRLGRILQCLGGLLGRLGGVLERLGRILERLGGILGRLGRVLGRFKRQKRSAVARGRALLWPGEHTIIFEERNLTELYRHPTLEADTQLGAFGPGADPKRSKAAYPPPRCVLDHKLNGSKFEEAGWTANSSKNSSKNLPKWSQNEGFWASWGCPGGILESFGDSWGVLGTS